MEIRDLEYFLAVLDHGSILGAAEARGWAQPALSRRMKALETFLGVPLLERSARGVKPTPCGSLLARHAQLVLRNRQRAIDDLGSLRDGIEGHARIGVGPAFAGLLPRAVVRLSEERPGLSLTVVEGTYDTLTRALRTGEIDGALSLLPPGEPLDGLAVKPLVEHRVLVLCGSRHPLLRRKRVRLADLSDERWALMSRPRSIVDVFKAEAAARGLERPRIGVETDSLTLLKSLVMDGRFLTVLPPGAVLDELSRRQIARLPVEDLPLVRAGILHRHEVLAPALVLLLAAVESELRSAETEGWR